MRERSARPRHPAPLLPLGRLALLLLLVPFLGACAGGAGRTPAVADEPLPTDPALVTGALDNGLAYMIRRHQTPPGRVALWLHVASGSLNETDQTQGLAHYLEHMAFNGSANFPPGALIPFFQSLGMSFGRDQNAFTGFDQTVYTMALPDTRPETLDRGLLYLSDVAFRMSLAPAEIDSERQVILEEKRARASARQRVRDEVLQRLAPESTLGRRLPIGTEEGIRGVGPAQFRQYYGRWYVASNMTLIAVGDVEPATLVQAIGRHFGSAAGVPRPAGHPAGIKATASARAIVATDPELTQAEISLTRLGPPRPPVSTVRAYRQRLVDELAAWMLRRRLTVLLDEGQAAFLGASASISDWSSMARVVTAQATAAPDRWRPALADLATALQRARQHGFRPTELDEARAAFVAQAEQAAQQEATLPARALIRRINESVSRREPRMSAEQQLSLQRRLLPDVSPQEVSQALAAHFDPAAVVFVLTLPSSAPAPSEAELVGIGRTALDVRPDPLPERSRPARLLAEPPRGGTVVEGADHAPTGVWSGWLDNGVRVLHRRIDERKGHVTVTVTLAGGMIQERGDDRGVTEAALQAWDRPATRTLSSTQIRTFMTGKKVSLRSSLGPDTVALTVAGDPADLPSGLELAYLLLTDPLVEAAGFGQWREAKAHELAERALSPRGALAEAEADALYPAGEARLRPLTAGQVRALTREAAQAWLARLIARAPMAVTVVGDMDRERATGLVARYLGALPERERIGATTLSELRSVARPTGPIRVVRSVPTRTDQAQVRDGFFAADVQDVRASRMMVLAGRVLSTRMVRVLREERQLVYSIGAQSRPGEAYPGFGVFAAQAPTDPGKAEALGEAITEMFAAFAAQGPSAEELAVAKHQLVNLVDETIKGAEFWIDRLATLDYRGLSLDDLARISADYQGFTVDEVRETFARYFRPESRFRIAILPEPRR